MVRRGIGEKTRSTKGEAAITDFDWARRRFAVCASAFKTVDSAQTFRIKSESGDYVPSRNDAWGDDAAPDTHFNVNLPMLSVESCEPISDISRPPNCFAFLLSVRDDLEHAEKEENDDKYSPHAVVRHYRFACENRIRERRLGGRDRANSVVGQKRKIGTLNVLLIELENEAQEKSWIRLV